MPRRRNPRSQEHRGRAADPFALIPRASLECICLQVVNYHADFLPRVERAFSRMKNGQQQLALCRDFALHHFLLVAVYYMMFHPPDTFSQALQREIPELCWELVAGILPALPWPMQEEVREGIKSYVERDHSWVDLTPDDRRKHWYVGTHVAQALWHAALTLRAENRNFWEWVATGDRSILGAGTFAEVLTKIVHVDRDPSSAKTGSKAAKPDRRTRYSDITKAAVDAPTGAGESACKFRREGPYWTVVFEGRTIHIGASRGLQHLSCILRSPGREFPAVALFAAAEGRQLTPRSSAGEVLDEEAISQYKARAEEISAEIQEARRNNDLGRVEERLSELEMLTEHMSAAKGLSGRRRTVGDTHERARKSVSQAITRAIGRIRRYHASLAEHLTKHVHLGNSVYYERDGTSWVM